MTEHFYVYIQKFKNNGLLAHESEVNKLQDEGDRLVEIIKHPGSPAITVRLSHTIVNVIGVTNSL